jgi:hypothetical protein
LAHEQSIEDYFEQHARSGNPQFAIAFALMRLAHEQKNVADALTSLGQRESGKSVTSAIETIARSIEGTK